MRSLREALNIAAHLSDPKLVARFLAARLNGKLHVPSG